MENARVILFEDEPEYVQSVGEAMALSSHDLIEVAQDMGAARRLVYMMEIGRLTASVVIMDGSLDGNYTSRDGRDAWQLFKLMREANLVSQDGVQGLKLIGFSRDSWDVLGIKVHRDPGKWNPASLPSVIDSIQPTDGWLKRQY